MDRTVARFLGLADAEAGTCPVTGEGTLIKTDVELSDQQGRARQLADALQQGAVVLVFYRGDW